MTDFRTLGSELSNWGRWGDDDRIGTVNLITAERIAAAATLRASGRVSTSDSRSAPTDLKPASAGSTPCT